MHKKYYVLEDLMKIVECVFLGREEGSLTENESIIEIQVV